MQLNKFSGLLALAPIVAGQLSVYPPGGPGIVYVTLDLDTETTGCLDTAGKWTVNEANCAAVFGNGQGGLSGPDGFYILDDAATITTTTVTWSTAWVGTHVSQARDAYDLIANSGSSPTGGPVWYASQIPEGDDTVTLSGTSSAGAQQVSLTFNSTFEG
ncbi:hypothetical protein AB5N19_02597 [Seiridium cardinale]|uniref:Uncharacterized protein n=1 Tax=Seiridium cardinale TaxID=138064 RepID=A0ABR2XW86_9PEZI